MSFNLGAAISGGMQGYKFGKDMQDQEAEAARKKKLGERADLTWQREEDFRNSLNPASPPAAGGISIAGQPSAIAPSGESAPRNIAAQGITQPKTTQPAQPAWEERARQLQEKERQSTLMPDGGEKFKQFFAADKARLMSEAVSELKVPEEGITTEYRKKYAARHHEAAQKLGAVITPEMIDKAAETAKKLKDEGVEEAMTALGRLDLKEANRLGAQGNLNWNLTNARKVKLANGMTTVLADNVMPDGKVVPVNLFEAQMKMLGVKAEYEYILKEREAVAKEKVATAATKNGGTPTDTYTFNPDPIMGGGTRLNKMTGETWTYDKSGKVISHSPAHTVGKGVVVPGVPQPAPTKVRDPNLKASNFD